MPRLRTAAFATLVGVAALVAFAPAASAHVTVSSTEAKQGGYAVINFRVPNEEANATTTKLQVQFPAATPFAYAATQPVEGWTAVETMTKLAKPITTDDGQITEGVSMITWTATSAAAIKPGQFQQFPVQLGPLPDKSSVTLPAIQTYSNGEIVKWVEVAAAGATEEPEHPAPVLQLAAASSAAEPTAGASATVASQPQVTESSDDSSSNTGPIVLSIIALVVALGALGLAFVGRTRRAS